MTRSHWDADLYDTRHSFVSAYGTELLQLLDPRPGERVLDAGCGTGDLAAELRSAGADTVGVDASPDMIEQARKRFPGMDLRIADLRDLGFREEFTAVLSNAVLHWIPEADQAAASMFAALRPGGRLVAELGGAGNVATLDSCARTLRTELGLGDPGNPWYLPEDAEYSEVVKRAGFQVTAAWSFDRPTRLEGEEGAAMWLRMFGSHLLADVADPDAFLAEFTRRLRPLLYRGGTWWADYRRLRITAAKPPR